MRKLKNDDRGVTLVEIIVSIAILAIIVLPFLNAFVTATKTNVKAKNEMNATHLATNIMEGIEKNSMKTLAYQSTIRRRALTLRTALIYQMEAVHVSFLRNQISLIM